MAEYIDREKLIKYIHNNGRNFFITEANRCNFAEIARMVKSEDVAPVVHGTWLLRHIGHGHYWECSVCHATPIYVTNNTNYCPNCGAKMDDEQQ